MRVYFDLTDEQYNFLQEHPDINLKELFGEALNGKINEMRIRAEDINVIIAAAGYNAGISGKGIEIPQALLVIKGKSLLERQVEVLRKFDINDITVVRGYKKEQFTVQGVSYIDNDKYMSTGIFHSFVMAFEKLRGRTILLYGDILFEGGIIEKLICNRSDFAIVVDRSWRDHYHNRVHHTICEAELVEIKDGGLVSRMGRDIPYESAYGEFIGLSSLSVSGAEKLKNVYTELKQSPDDTIFASKDLSMISLTDIYNVLIAKGEKIAFVDIHGGWFEIDTFEDYRRSWTKVK